MDYISKNIKACGLSCFPEQEFSDDEFCPDQAVSQIQTQISQKSQIIDPKLTQSGCIARSNQTEQPEPTSDLNTLEADALSKENSSEEVSTAVDFETHEELIDELRQELNEEIDNEMRIEMGANTLVEDALSKESSSEQAAITPVDFEAVQELIDEIEQDVQDEIHAEKRIEIEENALVEEALREENSSEQDEITPVGCEAHEELIDEIEQRLEEDIDEEIRVEKIGVNTLVQDALSKESSSEQDAITAVDCEADEEFIEAEQELNEEMRIQQISDLRWKLKLLQSEERDLKQELRSLESSVVMRWLHVSDRKEVKSEIEAVTKSIEKVEKQIHYLSSIQ